MLSIVILIVAEYIPKEYVCCIEIILFIIASGILFCCMWCKFYINAKEKIEKARRELEDERIEMLSKSYILIIEAIREQDMYGKIRKLEEAKRNIEYVKLLVGESTAGDLDSIITKINEAIEDINNRDINNAETKINEALQRVDTKIRQLLNNHTGD